MAVGKRVRWDVKCGVLRGTSTFFKGGESHGESCLRDALTRAGIAEVVFGEGTRLPIALE
jgi:hypothetical protein